MSLHIKDEEQVEGGLVAIRACESYDFDVVNSAVRSTIDALGGMGAFVSKGERILLKPNMLIPRRPEEAVTTHPGVLRVTIRLVKEAGGVPVVGDSPAGRSTERILRHLAERTGIASVCREEDVEFKLFTEGKAVQHPRGRVAKSFTLTSVVGEVDGIISIAKLKTHSFTRYTGAVKNLFGLVHGLKKAEYHMRMKDPRTFSEMLVDLAECVKPRLNIMDAVIGMDGDGPSAGRARHIGLVLASSNPHALDVVALKIVGQKPESVFTVLSAQQRGLLPRGEIRRVGDIQEGHHIEGFRMPPRMRAFGRAPAAIGNFVAEGVSRKPVFIRSACSRCGSCIEICPAEALYMQDKVELKRELCIRCYCCHEACPEKAIILKRMPFRSWLRSIRMTFRGWCAKEDFSDS